MSVLLSVPTRGAIQWTTVSRLEAIRDTVPGMSPILYQEGHVSEPLTRNTIVQQFLAGDWDVLAMVDDDTVPPPNLMEAIKHLAEYDVIGVPYPMMIDAMLEFAIFNSVEGGFGFVEPEPGVHECDAVGGGCMLIHRRVFDKLGDSPFRMFHDPRQFVTADLLFCIDIKNAGLKIGYWWDEWYANHNTTVSLGPLKDMQAMLMSAISPENNPLVNA